MTKYLIFALLAALLALYGSVKSCQNLKEEKERLSNNQRSLLSDVEFYRTKDSLSVAGVERLTLTKREIEKYNAQLTKEVKKLGVKVKRLESASTSAMSMSVAMTARVIDTVFVEAQSKPVKAMKFDWRDNWVSVSGIIREKKISCFVQSVDTLIQVVHRVPKRFLFFTWGTKAIRQKIISKNPHNRIVYSEYIELKK